MVPCGLTCRSAARRLWRVRCNGWLGVVHKIPTEASCKRDHAPKSVLIRFDARLLDHLCPLRDLGLDDRGELLRRAADDFQTKIGEFRAAGGRIDVSIFEANGKREARLFVTDYDIIDTVLLTAETEDLRILKALLDETISEMEKKPSRK